MTQSLSPAEASRFWLQLGLVSFGGARRTDRRWPVRAAPFVLPSGFMLTALASPYALWGRLPLLMGHFFPRVALLSFGGAYAVLP